MPARLGTAHHNAKLSPDRVRQMREWYFERTISFTELADEFEVSVNTARSAVTGRTWKNVPFPAVGTCPTCKGHGKVTG